MTPPAIAVQALVRRFATADGATRALAGIDLEIAPGEFVAITGRSGSGKSTLLNILGALDRGYDGSCRVGGVELKDLDDARLALLRRRTFGYVFQHYGLIPVLTCAENVALPAYYDGAIGAVRRETAGRLLADLGLAPRADRYPETLSGGEQQRVAIARAVINRAPILIADEPTGSLDSANATAVVELLERLHREGRTVILVTHEPALAGRADRVVTLTDGCVTDDRRSTTAARSRCRAAPSTPPAPATDGAAPLADRFAEAARMALRTIERRRLQSALTALGIAIGGASVIALATIGEGTRRQVIERIEALGSDLVTISRGPPGVRGGERLVTSLVAADQSAIAGLPGLVGLAPEMDGVVTVRHRDRDFLVTVTGTNEELPLVRDWAVEEGTFFGADAVRRHAQVAVLGATAARSLFDGEPAAGSYVLIGNAPFRVLGVMARKGVTTGPGHDRDNQIWVPHTTAGARLLARQYIDRIVVKLERGADAEAVAAELRARMLGRHGREDFSVNTLTEVIRAATRAQRTLDYFLGAIAAISLLVGGIGVMNIMLAAVNERTREIGIRMAVGAARSHVRAQFLFEAVVLCAAGGAAGVLLGVAAVELAALWSGIPARVTPGAVAAAVGSTLATGVVFGVAPASRAAGTDPATAFRRAT
jgi:macrolide transport system ATP-binding/permease protein